MNFWRLGFDYMIDLYWVLPIVLFQIAIGFYLCKKFSDIDYIKFMAPFAWFLAAWMHFKNEGLKLEPDQIISLVLIQGVFASLYFPLFKKLLIKIQKPEYALAFLALDNYLIMQIVLANFIG